MPRAATYLIYLDKTVYIIILLIIFTLNPCEIPNAMPYSILKYTLQYNILE